MNDLERMWKELPVPYFEALVIPIWRDRVRPRKTCKKG
jgi:hypothetical protein